MVSISIMFNSSHLEIAEKSIANLTITRVKALAEHVVNAEWLRQIDIGIEWQENRIRQIGLPRKLKCEYKESCDTRCDCLYAWRRWAATSEGAAQIALNDSENAVAWAGLVARMAAEDVVKATAK